MSFGEKVVRSDGKNFVGWPVPDSDSRENCVRKDLTRRLTSICADMPGPDFEALVQQMACEQLRGERVIRRVFGSS
jgi:hypothetical protein